MNDMTLLGMNRWIQLGDESNAQIYCEKTVYFYARHGIDIKLLAKIKKPDGWSRRVTKNHPRFVRITFRAEKIDTPDIPIDYFWDFAAKLKLIERHL